MSFGPGGFGGHRINWRAFAAFPFGLDSDDVSKADWRVSPELGFVFLANAGGYGSAIEMVRPLSARLPGGAQ